MTILDLLEKRAAAAAAARAILDAADREKRGVTTEEERAFDVAMDDLDAINERLERQEPGSRINLHRNASRKDRMTAIENALNASRGRKTEPGRVGGVAAATSGWRDSEGREVRVLTRGDKLAERGGGEYADLEMGSLLRAMILGPKTDIERRALSEGTDSAGGFTVPDITLRRFIDRMRAKTTVIQAGAQTVDLTSDTVKIARVATDPVAAWRSENGAVAESDPTFEAVTFVARSLAVMTKVSRELVEDSVNIEEALEGAMAGSMAVEVDRVALMGTGTPPEPRGIFNTTNVNSVSMGTNGAALNGFDNVIDAIYQNLLDNAQDATAAIMHPRTSTTFAKAKDGSGAYLARPDMIAKLPFLSTSGIPINQTQGSASNASTLFVGFFPDLFLGVRSGMQILVLRERFADVLQYGFLAHLRLDVQLAHPESFAKLIGIIP